MSAMLMVGIVLFCGSCSGGSSTAGDDYDNTLTEASLLRIGEDNGDYIPVDIINPWDTTAIMCRLALVPRGREVSDVVGRQLVMVPVERSVVSSAVHVAAIDSLGALGAVSGVTDAMYMKQPAVAEAIASGRIVDLGNSMSPSLEAVVAVRPEVILAIPYENAGYGVLEQTGAVIIPCADYMENTPLGRAEWIRLLGLLYGVDEQSQRWFDDTRSAYLDIKARAASASTYPKVLKEMVTQGVWYVPAGDSFQAALFEDAGADYPWKDTGGTGSLQLDFASVYDRASDADVWLLSTYGRDMTLRDLEGEYALNARFAPFASGEVYVTDTAESMLFEETPFLPHLLLGEYFTIFHPELSDAPLRYYHRAVPGDGK